jgi:hypothetical protein
MFANIRAAGRDLCLLPWWMHHAQLSGGVRQGGRVGSGGEDLILLTVRAVHDMHGWIHRQRTTATRTIRSGDDLPGRRLPGPR